MFMLKSTMELIDDKNKKIEELRERAWDLKSDLKHARNRADQAEKRADWEVEQIKNTVKKEMQKKLIESDLKRVEAVAKLNTYIDMDTKDERKKMSGMLEEAIKSLGKQKVTVNSK